MKLFNFLLVLLFIGSNTQFKSVNALCENQNILNIGIFATNQNPQDFISNGQIMGFDIDLYCAIAKLLGKEIVFKQISTVSNALNQLQSGELDMFGGTVLTINNLRLASFGFVRTDLRDPETSGCLALLFNTPTPIADSIQGVLAVNPAARFGSNGPGSFQTITLLADGVPPAQIIDISAVDLNTVSDIQAAFTNFSLTAIYIFSPPIGQAFAQESGGTLSVVSCVPLAPLVAGQGGGIAFNKQCCQLMINVQAALNIIVANGTYEALVQKQINNQLNSPAKLTGVGTNLLVPPPPNDSIINGFIPSNCLNLSPALPLRSPLTNLIISKYCTKCNFIFQPLVLPI